MIRKFGKKNPYMNATPNERQRIHDELKDLYELIPNQSGYYQGRRQEYEKKFNWLMEAETLNQ